MSAAAAGAAALRALGDVVAVLADPDADDTRFHTEMRMFLALYEEWLSHGEHVAGLDVLPALVHLENTLIADDTVGPEYPAAVKTIRDTITERRHQAANLN